MKTIRQAVASSILSFAEALKDFLHDNISWRTDLGALHFKASGPWNDSLRKFWSEKKVVGETFPMPKLQGGDKDKHYPFV